MSLDYAKVADPQPLLVQKFGGYRNKTDITNIPEEIKDRFGQNVLTGFLVSGSQNVIITDADRVTVRGGFVLDGAAAASTASDPVVSSYDWINHLGTENNLRVHNSGGSGIIEFRYKDSNGTITWNTLMNTTLNSTWDGTTLTFNFHPYWDITELLQLLLFVNGDSSVYMWSGGIATFASATANTVTLQGTKTWAQSGFLSSTANRAIVINGVKGTYSGGEGTTTLTGVSVDFSATAVGAVITQSVLNYANSAITSLPAAFAQDLIGVNNNQVYYGNTKRNDVYISKQNNFKDVSFTAGSGLRAPGEGAVIYLDATCVGFVVNSSPGSSKDNVDNMFIDAGQDYTYQIVFRLSTNLTTESLVIRRLETSPRSAARSQAAIARIKNAIVKISNEPTLDSYANLDKVVTPKSFPISDPIKSDFLTYNFANVHVLFFQSNLYIALPAQGLVLIYNLAKGYWEAPQILPIRRFAIIGGALYGHSSQVGETYQLFTGTSDNGNPINAIAAFPYENYGSAHSLKNFHEIYTEGYISSNTFLTLSVLFEYGGARQIWSYVIKGNDFKLQFTPAIDPSLGKNSIGDQPIGTISVPPSTQNKFRVIKNVVKNNFFEAQIVFQSNDVDQTWSLVRFGPSVTPTNTNPIQIKR